jgi:SAM-dependent methyltransferase
MLAQKETPMNPALSEAEFWNSRYATDDYAYGLQPNDFLLQQAGQIPAGAKLLCLAEGEGRNAVFLAKMGYDVRGVDFSQQGHDKAMQLAQQQGVRIAYDVSDLTQYAMGEAQYDAVVSVFCHLPSADRPALYQAVRRALRPGGVFILEAYTPQQLELGTGGPREADRLVTADELKDAFAADELLVLQELQRDIHEGAFHHGMSAVVQAVLRIRAGG